MVEFKIWQVTEKSLKMGRIFKRTSPVSDKITYRVELKTETDTWRAGHGFTTATRFTRREFDTPKEAKTYAKKHGWKDK